MKSLKENKTYIIAEAGVNHNGKLNEAKKLIRIAKDSGANAVKFQIFDIKEQVSKSAKTAPYQLDNTKDKNMFLMGQKYEMSFSKHKDLKIYCKKIGIDYMASCFDINSCNFLRDNLKINYIKVGSGEITNFILLKHIAKKFDTVILSTGMSTLDEINKALKILQRNSKNIKIILMHCVSMYPAKEKDLNLNFINFLKKKYNYEIGFSDHTLGFDASKIAVAKGCKYIEKHFTNNNNSIGPDHKMSLNKKDLKIFVEGIRKTEIMMGEFSKTISKAEYNMRKFARRSVVSIKEIKKNEIFTKVNIALKRPGNGIQPKYYNDIIGKRSKKLIKEDTLIEWSSIIK